MLQLNEKEKTLTLDLKEELGRGMGQTLVSILWLYYANDEESRAQLHTLSLMIRGDLPLGDYDLSEVLDVR